MAYFASMNNMKKILFALALLLTIGAIDAMAQSNPPLSNKRIRMKGQAAAPTPDPPTGYYNLWVDSASGNLYITNDAGTDTAVGAGITGLTDKVIPQANGTTAIENSKMTASGTNDGTWTLYDDTAVIGLTKLVITGGAGQGTDPLMALSTPAGISLAYFTLGTPTESWQTATDLSTGNLYFYEVGGAATRFSILNGVAAVAVTGQYLFNPASAANVGLENPSSGILKVTDGSTGQGGIGIADSATNTVTDALILRHQGGAVNGNGFGTGLVWQGENDGGVMHPMASIDAVYVTDDDTAEDVKLVFSAYANGAEYEIFTIDPFESGTSGPAIIFSEATGGPGRIATTGSKSFHVLAGGDLKFGETGVAFRWNIPETTGHFVPDTTNTYDIGTSSAFVRNNYVSTSIQGVRAEVIPSDNVAENFVVITSAVENAVTAGYIEYTVTAVDTTNEIIQTETGVVPFVAVNENGTVTASLGTPYGVHQDNAGGGALVVSFGSSVATTNVTFTVTSNYDEGTLTGTVVNTFRYRVVLTSGTATVTPDT